MKRLNVSPVREAVALAIGCLAILLEWRAAAVLRFVPVLVPLLACATAGILVGFSAALLTLVLTVGGLYLVLSREPALALPGSVWILATLVGLVFSALSSHLRGMYGRLVDTREATEGARRRDEALAARRAAIVRFGQDALGWRDTARLWEEALQLAARLADADAALALDEARPGTLRLRASVGLHPGPARGTELAAGHDSPWGRAMLQRSVVAFGPDEDRFAPLVDGHAFAAGLCVDVRAREGACSLLVVLSSTPGRTFDDEAQVALEELARTLGESLSRLRIERRLREQLVFSQAVTRAVREGICALDAEGRVTFANRAAAQLLGWSEAELVGHDLHALVGCTVPTDENACPLAGVRTGSELLFDRDDVVLRRRDGRELSVRLQVSRLVRGDERGWVVVLEDVAQRRRAQEERQRLVDALSAERARLQAILQQLPVPALVIEAGTRKVLLGNTLLEQALGVREGDVVGRGWDVRHPDGTPLAPGERPFTRALERGEAVSGLELELVRPGGEPRTFLVNSAPLHDEQGRVTAAVAAALDITGRREAERAAREVEQRYALAARAANDVLYDCDVRDGRIVWNDALRRLGYDEADPAHDLAWWEAQIHPSDRARVVPGLERALAGTQDDWSDEYRFRSADGVYRTLFDRGYIARDAEGRAVRIIGTMVDLTARKRREEEQRLLARASTLLAASLESDEVLASLAFLLVHEVADGCIVDVAEEEGSALRPVAVAAADEALESRLREKLSSPNAWERAHGAEAVLEDGHPLLVAPRPVDGCPPLAAGAHPPLLVSLGACSYLAVPLRAGGRTLGALTLWQAQSGRRLDANDLRLAEELASRAAAALENARLYREAQQAAHARERFLSVASHELRTPLTVLHLQLQRALQIARRAASAEPSTDAIVRVLGKAEEQSERIARLVGELLDVSRLAAGKLRLHEEEVDLAALVETVVEALRPEAQRAGCSVRLELADELHGVFDGLRIEQVVTNLFSNALKYGKGQPVEVRLRQQGGEALLEVQDHGIGIAPEHVERIFEPFERAVSERSFGGAGLGLYIARQIVQAHGGRLSVVSAPGRGSTFRVQLPLQPSARAAAEVPVLH